MVLVLLVFTVLALAIPIGIWLLTEQEIRGSRVVDRESAERQARTEFEREQGRDRSRHR